MAVHAIACFMIRKWVSISARPSRQARSGSTSANPASGSVQAFRASALDRVRVGTTSTWVDTVSTIGPLTTERLCWAALGRTGQSGTPRSSTHRTLPHTPKDVILEDVTGATAMSLEPTGGGDVVEQLNTVTTRMRWGWPVTIASLVLELVYPPYSLIVWVLLAPLCWWVFLHDQASRTVVLFYDVNDSHAAWFDSLVTQWDWLTGSQRLWRITQAGIVGTIRQFNINSGVDSIVDRIPVAASTDGPNNLSTNVAIPSLVARNSGLYFLPDRVLVKEGRRYSDVAYQYLKVSSAQTRFHESPGSVPGDAVQVGQTWQYVNVKGGPDHRYKNNPTLPIMLYGLPEITSPQGLSWLVRLRVPTQHPLLHRSYPKYLPSVTNDFRPATAHTLVGMSERRLVALIKAARASRKPS